MVLALLIEEYPRRCLATRDSRIGFVARNLRIAICNPLYRDGLPTLRGHPEKSIKKRDDNQRNDDYPTRPGASLRTIVTIHLG